MGNIDAANDKDYLDAYKIGAVLSVIDTSEVKVHSKINRLVMNQLLIISGLWQRIVRSSN